MTQEQIIEFAVKEWERIHEGSFPYVVGVEWEYFLKGIEVALQQKKWNNLDMICAYTAGRLSGMRNGEEALPGETSKWLEDYEFRNKEGI